MDVGTGPVLVDADADGMGMFAPIPTGTIAAPGQAAASEEQKQMDLLAGMM